MAAETETQTAAAGPCRSDTWVCFYVAIYVEGWPLCFRIDYVLFLHQETRSLYDRAHSTDRFVIDI